MATADYDVRIDWNDDGDFGDTGEDVSSRTMAQRTPIRIQYGRDQARSLAPPQPGTALFELNNESRDYSPANASSPLFGNLETGRETRIQATHDATTYALYRGFLDDYKLLPNNSDRSVQLTAIDGLGQLRGQKISTAVHHSIRTGEAINLILDAAGWPEADRDIDLGASTIRWWWEEETDAFTALVRTVNTEGPPAIITADGDGAIVFRDRHHRLLDSASLTSQATFRGTGTEPLHSEPMIIDHGWKHIVNAVTFSVDEYAPAMIADVVWTSDRSISVADGETVQIRAESTEPFINAITPEAGTDYILQSGSIEVTLTRDSGASTLIRIKATGGPAVIDSLQLRAFPLTVARTVQVRAEEPVSIGKYRRRTYDPPPTPWLNANDAVGIADVILAHRATRRPTVQIVIRNANDARLTQMLERDLSDRITIIEDEASLSDEFYIEQIQHFISDAGMAHTTTFSCEQVAEQVSNAFTFDVTGQGFDDGVFGEIGFDDPDTMFRFDTAGQGFDDGLFAH